MASFIYYRESLMEKAELEAARKYFDCYPTYLNTKPGDLCIPRYAMLPFYKDQERDIRLLEGRPINSYKEHRYVADMMEWYEDLRGYTPRTWTRLQDLPEEGPFVLKGETNSLKFHWNTHMFAQTKRDAIEVHSRLLADSLISYQNIYIRSYVPLNTYFTAIQGLPVSKEFRFFILNGVVLCGGFYWSSHTEEIGFTPSPEEVPQSFLTKATSRVGDKVSFYTLDVAQTAEGDWIVIELNDGCQAGLSCIDPDLLYRRMAEVLNEKRD